MRRIRARRSVSAGLVVMRLVDNWVSDGATKSRVDGWSISAVREAIAEIPDGAPVRRMLGGIVDVIVSSTSIDMHALTPRLMAYGQSLEYDSKWALAADVYRNIIAHAHPADDADLVVTAFIQLAFALRTLGDLDSAAAAYEQASSVALAAGDLIGVLRWPSRRCEDRNGPRQCAAGGVNPRRNDYERQAAWA